MPPTVAGTYSTALPGMGTPPTTKAPYNNAGLSFNVGGAHSLGPQGWALRAVHNHNPHGKLLVPEHC